MKSGNQQENRLLSCFTLYTVMEQCPFCEPGIERSAFLFSKNFLTIYNQSPILPGHSLVIPKDHYKSLLDMPAGMTHELMGFSIHAVKRLKKIFHAEAFDWTIQDGEAAGQTVPHVHLHLIPRTKGDLPEPGDWYPKLEYSKQAIIDSTMRKKLTDQQVLEIAEQIRNRIPEKDRRYRG